MNNVVKSVCLCVGWGSNSVILSVIFYSNFIFCGINQQELKLIIKYTYVLEVVEMMEGK